MQNKQEFISLLNFPLSQTSYGAKLGFKVELSHSQQTGYKGTLPVGYKHKYLAHYKRLRDRKLSLKPSKRISNDDLTGFVDAIEDDLNISTCLQEEDK
jgi:hypothetical protein